MNIFVINGFSIDLMECMIVINICACALPVHINGLKSNERFRVKFTKTSIAYMIMNNGHDEWKTAILLHENFVRYVRFLHPLHKGKRFKMVQCNCKRFSSASAKLSQTYSTSSIIENNLPLKPRNISFANFWHSHTHTTQSFGNSNLPRTAFRFRRLN